MPFRERVRKALGGRDSTPTTPTTASCSSPSSSPDSPTIVSTPTELELKPVDTKTSLRSLRKITSRKPKEVKKSKRQIKEEEEAEKWKDWPEHIYKPHEMPKLRYRRTPDPKHKEHLESYSWEKAFGGLGLRRRSRGSLYSPMGSRLPSRINSVASRKSRMGSRGGRESVGPSRNQSVAEVLDEDESEGGGVENVGLSRQTTHHDNPSPSTSTSTGSAPELVASSSVDSDGSEECSVLATSKTVTKGDVSRADTLSFGGSLPQEEPLPGKPFSEEELVRALSRTGGIVDGED